MPQIFVDSLLQKHISRFALQDHISLYYHKPYFALIFIFGCENDSGMQNLEQQKGLMAAFAENIIFVMRRAHRVKIKITR